jgi:hypothetical protein
MDLGHGSVVTKHDRENLPAQVLVCLAFEVQKVGLLRRVHTLGQCRPVDVRLGDPAGHFSAVEQRYRAKNSVKIE